MLHDLTGHTCLGSPDDTRAVVQVAPLGALLLLVANVLQLGSPMPIEQRYQDEHGDWILAGEIRLA